MHKPNLLYCFIPLSVFFISHILSSGLDCLFPPSLCEIESVLLVDTWQSSPSFIKMQTGLDWSRLGVRLKSLPELTCSTLNLICENLISLPCEGFLSDAMVQCFWPAPWAALRWHCDSIQKGAPCWKWNLPVFEIKGDEIWFYLIHSALIFVLFRLTLLVASLSS